LDLIERSQGGTGRHPWEVARARFFLHLLERIVGPGPTKVLDVGSGDAWLADQLASSLPDLAITCWDVNYTPEETDELGHEHPRLAFTATVPDDRFGGVLMLDVVEHVEDDLGFVGATLGDRLVEGGWVLVSVPAYQSLFTLHDTWLKHYRRYSPRECRDMLESAGLVVEAEGGLFHSLLPIRGLSAAKERVRRPTDTDHGIGGWNGGALATKAVTALLDADASMSLWFGTRAHRVVPGLSYWAFCRRAPVVAGA
jgi:hypothetical protein